MIVTKYIIYNVLIIFMIITICLIIPMACKQTVSTPVVTETPFNSASGNSLKALGKLSEYNKFSLPLKDMKAVEDVFPYDLNASLFTDYAYKKRFIFLPDGQAMNYHEDKAFDFPEGSMIFKFFYYPVDFRKSDVNLQMIETRVLIKEQDEWTALTYIWNKEQTDAILAISGNIKHVSWTDIYGKPQQVNYSIPNLIQCKSCHEFQGKMMPIGPAARHLNKTYSFGTEQINQLDYLTSTGKLNGLKPRTMVLK
ncbi:MAG: hypothetical protein IPO92_17185 [Saprospiraceae bacterium]|nr:hypothetical protein [Saprospiraceae bacterium]